MIQLKNVVFGHRTPLVKVSELQLKSSEIYALLGRNGKGKSTIISTINGQIPALEGSILLNEKDQRSLSVEQKAMMVTSVSSKFEGIDHLTVEDYIALGRTPYLNLIGKMTEADKSKVSAIIKELKIEHLRNSQTTKISDGERQLAAIGRALVQETPIITLDEPTAFLDYINKKHLIVKLKEIAVEMGKCILFSTHDIELCFETGTSILFINHQGQLEVFSGSNKEELLDLAFEA